MTVKSTEVGKTFNVGMSFDLTGSTNLKVNLTNVSTGAKVTVETPRTSAPLVEAITEVGTLPAGTYIQFLTIATDFPVAGDYNVCGVYVDGTPKEFYGDDALITVPGPC